MVAATTQLIVGLAVTLFMIVTLSFLLSPLAWYLWNYVMPSLGVPPLTWVQTWMLVVLAHLIFPGATR